MWFLCTILGYISHSPFTFVLINALNLPTLRQMIAQVWGLMFCRSICAIQFCSYSSDSRSFGATRVTSLIWSCSCSLPTKIIVHHSRATASPWQQLAGFQARGCPAHFHDNVIKKSLPQTECFFSFHADHCSETGVFAYAMTHTHARTHPHTRETKAKSWVTHFPPWSTSSPPAESSNQAKRWSCNYGEKKIFWAPLAQHPSWINLLPVQLWLITLCPPNSP